MAADLHIHIFKGIAEYDLEAFFSNTFGSKYFAPKSRAQQKEGYDLAFERIAATPNIWVGEVSWLKAALSGDSETFIPSAVQRVNEIIGKDLPVIDEAFIAIIETAMESGNSTGYSVASSKEVGDFLRQHIGERCFTVSW